MKRKLLIFLLLFIGTTTLFVACDQDDWLPDHSGGKERKRTSNRWHKPHWSRRDLDQEAWREAQAQYDLNKEELEAIMTRSSEGHPLFEGMVPSWRQSYTRKGDGYTSVETVLRYSRIKMMVMSECEQKYQLTGDRRYLQTLTRLVILLYDDGRQPDIFFMTISPSVKYMELTRFRPFYNTYPVRDKRFDGKIHFHNLQGEYVNGWLYRNGKIICQLLPAGKDELQTRGTYLDCERIYEKQCQQTNEGEDITDETGEATITAECEEVFVDVVCVTKDDGEGESDSDDNSDDYGGWGNSGGNYGGGSQHSGGTRNTVLSKLMDKSGSNLNSDQMNKLNDSLDSWMTKYPLFKKTITKMLAAGRTIRFSIDPILVGKEGSARYDPKTGTIYYYAEVMMSNIQSMEEFVHAAQYQLCYNPVPGLKNIEFEAKMICDMMQAMAGNNNTGEYKTMNGISSLSDALPTYENFWERFESNGYEVDDILLCIYHALGGIWDDPNYHNVKGYKESEYDSNIKPKLINTIFK